MMKHTKGPWTRHYEPSLNRHSIRAGFAGTTTVCCTYESAANRIEALANANLIAAAPRLLEALREFVGCVDAGATFADRAVLDFARAAIAEATKEA